MITGGFLILAQLGRNGVGIRDGHIVHRRALHRRVSDNAEPTPVQRAATCAKTLEARHWPQSLRKDHVTSSRVLGMTTVLDCLRRAMSVCRLLSDVTETARDSHSSDSHHSRAPACNRVYLNFRCDPHTRGPQESLPHRAHKSEQALP